MTTQAVIPAARPQALRRWHLAILALFVIGLVAAFETTRPKAKVRVTSPSYGEIETTVSGTGTVVPEHDFPARANFSGIVEGVFVYLGQKVRAGEMLVRMKDQYSVPRLDNAKVALDDAEVSAQNVQQNGSQEDRIEFGAELVRVQADRDQAAKALAAMRQIEPNGSVTEAEVDAATDRLKVAEANLRAVRERITHRYSAADQASWNDRVAAEKASLQAEKVSWANANISTPIAGTVYLLSVARYDFAPAGMDLLHVADLSHLKIRADFRGARLGKTEDRTACVDHVGWAAGPDVAWASSVEASGGYPDSGQEPRPMHDYS